MGAGCRSTQGRRWKIAGCLLAGTITIGTVEPAIAQIIPDTTLGTENSVVSPTQTVIRGVVSDRISGGAQRGANLFHSFDQFNISAGHGAYFVNPAGVENILSRVTGSDPSDLFGTLGVLGDANLFLLNPNGILFGAEARLDVAGSFVATTAEVIALGDQGFFSAVAPAQSSLLSVNPGALFFNQVSNQGGRITSTGQLVAGQDLTLAGDRLNLQGQVQAGRNLTLQARDTVQIRDSALVPFVAAAGGQMVVQGDRAVDIFALNHPNSGLFSGGDMVLRSASQVGGDAHYWSGGNFRVEQLNGILGQLFSPYDPIIRSRGDVSLGNYFGASLHILAGGQVTLGEVFLTGPDTLGSTVNSTNTPNLAEVRLSNGTVINIDGSRRPTLDIRAGVKPEYIGLPGIVDEGISFLFNPPTLTESPTRANIRIGSVRLTAPDGLVLLTNQYHPNLLLAGGNIQLVAGVLGTSGISARSNFGSGGDVILDARRNIALVPNTVINTSATFPPGHSGSISLLAQNALILDNAQISGSNGGSSPGGNINLQANVLTLRNATTVGTIATGSGRSGNIDVTTIMFTATKGSQLVTATTGSGRAGNITIRANQSVLFAGTGSDGLATGALSQVGPEASGRGGNVTINAGSLSLTHGAQVQALTLGQQDGGDITVNTTGAVVLQGESTGLLSSVQSGAVGNVGDIRVHARSLTVRDGAQVQAIFYRAQGISGGRAPTEGARPSTIDINATDFVELIGSSANGFSSGLLAGTERGADGPGGNIRVNTNRLQVTDGATINAQTQNASDGGNISIRARTFTATQGGQVLSLTRNSGNAGDISLQIADSITISGTDPTFATRFAQFGTDVVNNEGAASGLFSSASSDTSSEATGNGGNILVTAPSMILADQGQITAQSVGTGRAGDIVLNVRDRFLVRDSNITTQSTRSNGGNISINAMRANNSQVSLGDRGVLVLTGDSDITTNSQQDGGDITLGGQGTVAFDDSDIITRSVEATGGDITLSALFSETIPYGSVPDDTNDQVDLNTEGRLAPGRITTNDTSFIQNNLSDLTDVAVNADTLIANSCIARTEQGGTFLITGSGGLPERPGQLAVSTYATGTVQTLPAESSAAANSSAWQIGDPVVEPQDVFQLSNGRLVISRNCE